MDIHIYAGPAPSRDLVLQFSAQLARRVATSLVLVSGGGPDARPLLEQAAAQLDVPAHVPVTLRALPGNAQAAVQAAVQEQPCDLVVLGRLNNLLGRLLPSNPRSKALASALEPSVLRVHGAVQPIQRILLASGGDFHVFQSIQIAEKLARPLGAEVTILHVRSHQSLLFEGPGGGGLTVGDFLAGDAREARTLREAAATLNGRGVPTRLKGRAGLVRDEVAAELREGSYALLISGAHHANGPLDHMLLENVTNDLLDVSPLPVLIAKW